MVKENVIRIMHEKGLKQGFVANRAGYTYQSFNNILNGRKRIYDVDVLKLAIALDVTPNELFKCN